MSGTPQEPDEGTGMLEQARLSTDEKRAQLRRLLERRAAEPRTAPLSSAQERLWFLDQLAPGSPLFNIPAALRITGRLDLKAAERSLHEIVSRHETLRTTFTVTGGGPVQRIAPSGTLPLRVLDLRHLPGEEREAAALTAATDEAQRPFDLARGPLLRMTLMQLGDEDYLLLVTMHHIISDGWSIAVFIREALATYYAFSTGAPLVLPELPIQYTDFVHWQRDQLEGPTLQSHLCYWKDKLAHLSVLELPTDRPRPAILSPRGASCSLSLPADLTQALRMLGRRENATLFMVLLAAFQTVLHRYTGQDDLVVGTLVSGRNRAELEDLIGCFINAVTIRTDFAGNPTFRELLARVRKVALEAYAHEDVPFEKIVEAVQPRRDLSRTPLFQVMLILQGTALPAPKSLGLTVRPHALQSRTAKFDLNLSFVESDDGLLGNLEYSTDLFEGSTIARMLTHLRRVLEAIVADPDHPVGRLPLLTDAELHQQLVAWNDTAVDYGPFRCIHEIIEAQVERTPDAVALVFQGEQLTYAQLNRRANQLAYQLRALGVGPDVCIGVYLERSLELVIALLGVLKAGGAYLPLDPAYPRERLEYMLQNAQAPILLTRERLLGGVPEQPARVICVETACAGLVGTGDVNPFSGAGPEHLAYVIYTSGSTGQPKGVMNTHEGIRNRLLWMQETYGLTPADRVLQKTPSTFDVSAWEFFWPLMTGACLVIARPDGHKDSAYLVRVIGGQRITTAHFVPSMLQAFLCEEGLEALEELKRVFCSGEALSVELQERFFARLNAELHNLYGPTEAAIDVTFWACRRHDPRPAIPIGRPIANTQIYILDSRRQPVPVGVPGELYIGGVGLARGYLNRPDLTAESFVPHPFGAAGERLYRTGDRARFLPGGEIEFLGRIDHQIKIQGVRIEPGEIEAALRRHPAVRDALLVQREDTPGDRRLVGYFVADSPGPTSSELRSVLRQTLPDYLIPSAFVRLDSFPLSTSGKVDRPALPGPDRSRPELERAYVAPQTELETALARIWGEVLGIEHVGVHDNFFELGGHSLLAIQLLFRVRDACAVDLSLPTLMQQPTVGELALAIEALRGGGTAPLGERLDLEAEVVLDSTVGAPDATVQPTRDTARVFLTGASGFVGRFVLAELLEQTSAHVYCLVRAENEERAGGRLRESLQAAGLWKPGWEARIIPVLGDLARPRLGIGGEAFSALATTVDEIYHCGALVNFLYPYAALKGTNVLGTHEILRLASQGRLKPVHYLSTLAIFSVQSSQSRVIREHEQPEHPEMLRGGYAQSKWVAERLVGQARARGLPVVTYRLPLVTGSLSSGLVKADDLANMLLRACILLGSIPNLHVSVNAVPIDYVARALVHLAKQPPPKSHTYHLANPRSIPSTKVVEYVRAFGYPLRQVPYEEWLAELRRHGDSTQPELLVLPRLLPEHRPDAGFATPEFDCQNTTEALGGTSIICPSLDGEWFQAYLSAFVRDGLLEAPTAGTSHG